jgi:endo-1,4-beta-xylanase
MRPDAQIQYTICPNQDFQRGFLNSVQDTKDNGLPYPGQENEIMSAKSIVLAALAAGALFQPLPAQTTLKDAFQGSFRIGAALARPHYDGSDPAGAALVAAQFDAISPENDLKWQPIHPTAQSFNFDPADHYVEFGEKNHMFIIGHCLIWHAQTPRWVFEDEQGKEVGRDELLRRMHDHIAAVVGRYKGRINGWDVVNEALNEDGTLRRSQWQRIIGDDYIAKAFEYAHEADPKAELYYNEYSLENEAKRKGCIELIRKLLAAGVPVKAVGLQGHYNMEFPAVEQLDATISAFAALGVKVNITELDIDVLPRVRAGVSADINARAEAAAAANPYTSGLPAAKQQELADRYAALFKVFLKHRGAITRVTFWGVTDKGSWLNNWPARGRTNYPLLFDREGKPKPAFDAVIAEAKAASTKGASLPSAPPVEFEVATVKPSAPYKGGNMYAGGGIDPALVRFTNLSLENYIQMAYELEPFELSAPDWTRNDHYDITAKVPAGSQQEQFPAMLRGLLEQRFQLRFHREPKVVPVFALVVASGGLKAKPSATPPEQGTQQWSYGHLDARATSFSYLAGALSHMRAVGCPVVDRTGVRDVFDFTLDWAESDEQEGEGTPTIRLALMQKLGLKLEPLKLPVEILVIDHVERKPSEN